MPMTCGVSEKMRKIRDKHAVDRRKEKGILAVTKLYLQKIKLPTSTMYYNVYSQKLYYTVTSKMVDQGTPKSRSKV